MGQPVEAGILQEFIEQAGLFVIPLDGERYWFRYHHLFGEIFAQPVFSDVWGRLTSLYLKASEWLERRGLTGEAIDHALSACAYDKASELLQSIAAEMPDAENWRR